MSSRILETVCTTAKQLARRSVLIPFVSMVTLLCVGFSVASVNTFTVYDDGRKTVFQSYTRNTEEALRENGYTWDCADTLTMPEFAEDGQAEVSIVRGKTITLTADGKTVTMRVPSGKVADVLPAQGIEIGEQDELSCGRDAIVTEGMQIQLVRVTTYEEEAVSTIKHSKKIVTSYELASGESKIQQAGVDGEKVTTYRITLRDGVEVNKEKVGEVVTREPQAEITVRGVKRADNTAREGIVTSRAGNFRYKKAIQVTATAYTCEGKKWNITKSGQVARVGLIAVDPRVIPLGTRMYIESPDGSFVYGTAVAADTGGAIKGNKIDLYMDTYRECVNFGRRKMIVYILE
ncbi:MAG: DUF348 domain-containing protein [Oscillospiraceae bacterium]|nr:DUF348 domain-containing protein [Oscillospiraceae bacterium]